MNICDCRLDAHAEQMLDIVNDTIAHTTWVYDYAPRTAAQLSDYITARQTDGFPVIVAEDEHERLLGFGSFGAFRALPGYRYTVEHSVFVAKSARRRGVGSRLLAHLIDLARRMNQHVLIGAIDSTNLPSIALHEALGFERCGTMHEVGYKHGRWLDVLLYEYVLDTPVNPTES